MLSTRASGHLAIQMCTQNRQFGFGYVWPAGEKYSYRSFAATEHCLVALGYFYVGSELKYTKTHFSGEVTAVFELHTGVQNHITGSEGSHMIYTFGPCIICKRAVILTQVMFTKSNQKPTSNVWGVLNYGRTRAILRSLLNPDQSVGIPWTISLSTQYLVVA